MHKEQVQVGSFDATKNFFHAIDRNKWADALETNLADRNAIFVIDARESPLPPYLTDRLTEPDIAKAASLFDDMFGPEWKTKVAGKTFAMAYTKFGHGHKHQAYDMSLLLAHMTRSRVVCFDPMDALPMRERNGISQAKAIHKAMQDRNTKFLDELREVAKHPPESPVIFRQFDRATNMLAINIAELAFKHMPAQNETGNTPVQQKPSLMDKIIEKSPEKIIRPIIEAQVRLTERSVSAATATIAARYDADAILTTHPNTLRGLTPDALPWVPRNLRKKAKHALQTIITLIPDNGYVIRKPDGSEEQPMSRQELMDDLVLSSSFAFVMHRQASWLRRGLHVVADKLVAKRFHEYWNIPDSQLFPFGTIADTIIPEQMDQKWNTNERRILLASNGNGSNIPDAIAALREIAAIHHNGLKNRNIISTYS